ncbi:cytochrome c [Thauera sp. CAU 1555]|uniref:Cytochrome c n=1 Tax=Thauera sedimentorum TaxID=2767595 RepID=A0ABR9B5D8_9RHOO|nr:cytochrome c [Thauera sedimentorum]MBC9070664.1 cytochrome c [Thauera sedimentorum]MBD8501583.1 cytochrome c [Thauera sedimentorum]
MRAKLAALGGLAGFLGLALGAWMLAGDAPASGLLRPDDATLTERGRQVYLAHCAACHGAELQGQPDWRTRGADGSLPAPPHDASGHTWHHPDELLFRMTKYGVGQAAGLEGYESAMPAYEGLLDDEEIVAVLSWIKSQWPAEVRAMHDQVNARAQAVR